ncbi:MAG: hypothetical protein ABFS45_12175 [Pseudomonadota bacterium]
MGKLDADETALRDYAEQHQHPGRDLDDVVAEWSALWEQEYGERPDAERIGHFRWHVEACRCALRRLDGEFH